MKEEKKLIRRCIQGDPIAQRALVDRYGPFLLTTCRRYVSGSIDAQDVLQESFIRIFKSLRKIDFKKGTPLNYMNRICINVALSKRLRLTKRNESLYQNKGLHVRESTVPEVYSQLNVETLMNYIKQIPKTYGDVFNLFVVEGYSHGEISTILGIGESSSRVYLIRARSLLKEKILKNEGSRIQNRSI